MGYKFGLFVRRFMIVVIILAVIAGIAFGGYQIYKTIEMRNNIYNNSSYNDYNDDYDDDDDDDDDYYGNGYNSYNDGYNNNNYNDNYNDSYVVPVTEAPTTEVPTTEEPTTEAPEEGKYMVCTVDTLRVRSQPNTNCTIVGRIHKGDKIKVTGMENSEWCIVEYKGKKAYCAVEYLKDN